MIIYYMATSWFAFSDLFCTIFVSCPLKVYKDPVSHSVTQTKIS
jgi:hypothetical protein